VGEEEEEFWKKEAKKTVDSGISCGLTYHVHGRSRRSQEETSGFDERYYCNGVPLCQNKLPRCCSG
jgi:hypothetical protein